MTVHPQLPPWHKRETMGPKIAQSYWLLRKAQHLFQNPDPHTHLGRRFPLGLGLRLYLSCLQTLELKPLQGSSCLELHLKEVARSDPEKALPAPHALRPLQGTHQYGATELR